MTQRSCIPVVRLAGLFTLTLGLFACDSDKPIKCRFVGQTTLTENPATQLASASLLPAGDNGFVLAGLDGTTVHWAPLSRAGVVGTASTFAIVETTVLPPRLAALAKTTAGDQLLAVYGTSNANNQILIQAVTQVAGEAAAAPKTLATLPAGLNLADVRMAVGNSRTGLRALVAWGLVNQPGTKIETRVLGADATQVGEVISLDPGENWTCLQFVPSRSDWGLSWIRTPASGNFRVVIEEGQDVGTTLARYTVGMNTNDTTCPVVAPSERGYVFGFQTRAGTWVTDYEILSSTVSSEFVAAGVRFGTPDQQPPIGGVASMGLDAAVLFGLTRGPEVWLFDPFGSRVGSELKLPANVGGVGAVSSWPSGAALYTTYREGVPATLGPSAGPRWFMKVECPSN